MIDRRLVERSRDVLEGRAARLALTMSGRDLLSRAQQSVDDLLAAVLADWDAERVLALAEGLQRFTADLAAHTHSASSAAG